MELQNPNKDGNEKTLEPSVVENEKDANDEVVPEAEAETEKDENEVVDTTAGEKTKEDENSVETSMDVEEENKTGNGTVEKSSVRASVEASSSGKKKPEVAAKNKIINKVKKLVKKKISKGTTVPVAGEKNVTVEQGVKEVITVVNNEKDEQNADPLLVESEKEIEKVIESGTDSPQHSLGGSDMESNKELDDFSEAPADDDEKVAEAEPSGEKTLIEVKGQASTVKQVGKRLLKGGKFKGSLAQGKGKESETMLQGAKEGVDLASIAPTEGNAAEAEKAIEGSVESPENGVEKSNLVEVNTNEGDQQMTLADESKQNQLTENKAGSAEGKRRRRKRPGKQNLGANKKQKNEVGEASGVAGDVTQQNMEEKKEEIVDPEKKEKGGDGKAKIGGLIFMCNGKTKTDCFKFSVMGVQEKRKDYVMGIKPGVKLFLYDYELKLLYGVFQASSAGGMKLERNAFGGSFPAQVRFKVVKDCIPLPERQFKNAIKENYNNRNKFKTELTYKQVSRLTKLFRPAPLTVQVTNTQPIPVGRNADRKRSNKDRFAAGSSKAGQNRAQERSRRNDIRAPPPRREEPPRDLFLSEREYRTYGLRRGGGEETSQQHYPIPPPDSSYHRDRVPLDSYHHPSSVDHDRLLRLAEIERRERQDRDHERLLRQAEIERHERDREVRRLRDYDRYDHHLSSRREILARISPEPPASAVALDSYRRDRERDPYYSYEYRDRDLERQPPRTYLTTSSREEDDLYSRYVTPDSLAEYYRSSRRYPSLVESELPPPSSRYDSYSGSLPYSHR